MGGVYPRASRILASVITNMIPGTPGWRRVWSGPSARCSRVVMLVAVVAVPLGSVTAAAQSTPAAVALPSRYVEDRFFVRPVTARGDTLNLFTDTGGGGGYLRLAEVQRRSAMLSVLTVRTTTTGADTIWGVRWPELRPDAWIPQPALGEPALMYVPTGRRAAPGPLDEWQKEDGFLGTTWFQDRVWTFDYPQRQLLLHSNDGSIRTPGRVVPLGFRTDSSGRRDAHYPRIAVEVDGDTLQLLFDTGATTLLSAEALAIVADGRAPARATSFIMRRVFDRWRAKHPGWRVIHAAETFSQMEMIEVPVVRIAGFAAGPVWFTVRNDINYVNFSRSFDQPIAGALGGNALRTFRVTVDYPRALAVFEQRTSTER
jgi:hypothetical protein